jgi:hypothetical protein
MSLGDALRAERPVPEALVAYEAERLPVGRRIIERARQLGTYLQRDFASEAERQAAEPFPGARGGAGAERRYGLPLGLTGEPADIDSTSRSFIDR